MSLLSTEEINANLQLGMDQLELASLDIIELEYLAIIFENKGEKKALNEILQGADSPYERNKRWNQLKTLQARNLIYEVRNEHNKVVKYRYHSKNMKACIAQCLSCLQGTSACRYKIFDNNYFLTLRYFPFD